MHNIIWPKKCRENKKWVTLSVGKVVSIRSKAGPKMRRVGIRNLFHKLRLNFVNRPIYCKFTGLKTYLILEPMNLQNYGDYVSSLFFIYFLRQRVLCICFLVCGILCWRQFRSYLDLSRAHLVVRLFIVVTNAHFCSPGSHSIYKTCSIRRLFHTLTSQFILFIRSVAASIITTTTKLTSWLMKPGGLMPHSQGLSNNPYPEPNQPNYPHSNIILPSTPRPP